MFKQTSIFLILIFLLTGVVEAATLTTAPLRIDNLYENGNSIECFILNVSKINVVGKITAVIEDQIPLTLEISLEPGRSDHLIIYNNQDVSKPGWCIFEFKGRKRRVRSSVCALDNNFNCRAALPAQ